MVDAGGAASVWRGLRRGLRGIAASPPSTGAAFAEEGVGSDDMMLWGKRE